MKPFDSSNPAVWSCHTDIAAATPYMMTPGEIWRSKLEQSGIMLHIEWLHSVNNNAGECYKLSTTLQAGMF